MELALVAGARARRLPVLAICRGLQVLNVTLGGTLWQDLPLEQGISGHDFTKRDGFPLDHPAHPIAPVALDHPIARWLARVDGTPVNSRHHQAVHAPGAGLVAAAHAPDGVVEAMTWEDPAWWVWGVQWHPENLIAAAPQRALFEEFLAAVREVR
jgi:putative glutamine amidotransferase